MDDIKKVLGGYAWIRGGEVLLKAVVLAGVFALAASVADQGVNLSVEVGSESNAEGR